MPRQRYIGPRRYRLCFAATLSHLNGSMCRTNIACGNSNGDCGPSPPHTKHGPSFNTADILSTLTLTNASQPLPPQEEQTSQRNPLHVAAAADDDDESHVLLPQTACTHVKQWGCGLDMNSPQQSRWHGLRK